MERFILVFILFFLSQCNVKNDQKRGVVELNWFKTEVINYNDIKFPTKGPAILFYLRFKNNAKKEILAIDCIKDVNLMDVDQNILVRNLKYTVEKGDYTLPGKSNIIVVYKELLISNLTSEDIFALQEGDLIFNPNEGACDSVKNRIPLDELERLQKFQWRVYNQFKIKKTIDYSFQIN